jgi:hypothetical protein
LDRKDLVGLLMTLDLGILAAALTLLAIYPAIAAVATARGNASASAVVAYENRRRTIFRNLGMAAFASFLALLALLLIAVLIVAVPAGPGEKWTICCGLSQARLEVLDLWTLRMASLLTVISLLGVGLAGWAILQLTKETG